MTLTKKTIRPIKNKAHNSKNNLVFVIAMVVVQIVIVTMTAIYIRVDYVQNMPIYYQTYRTIGFNLLLPFIMALVIVIGFSLIFSYNKKMLFSGIGFSFFIFAFVIQFYPLVNAIWTKTKILSYA
jgi:hypothetical protein